MGIWEEKLLEELASLEHEQWIHWTNGVKPLLADCTLRMYNVVMKYYYETHPEDTDFVNDLDEVKFDDLIEELGEQEHRVTQRLFRWDDLKKPYVELSEEYKEEDRVHARKVIDLLKKENIFRHSRLENKGQLLHDLYNLEYDCKISGFDYEADKLNDLILHIRNEISDGTPREVICAKNCGLCDIEVEGHGWYSHTCIATGRDAPLGKKCTVTEESYVKFIEKEHRKKWGGSLYE